MKKYLLFIITFFYYSSSQAQCQSNFSYSQNGPTTIFTDLSTIQSTNYSIIDWSWDFGDGTASNQQNPTHNYSNGFYSVCLTVTFFDSIIVSPCVAIYCDTIQVTTGPPASWDCNPSSGCYDPMTGGGQYSTLSACQNACVVTPTWSCNPNTLSCYDPGNGTGQYSTLAACQSACGMPQSWDCDPVTGCHDPGTGLGQFISLGSCDTFCSVSWNCDPNTLSCYDPGNGTGQYITLVDCQNACAVSQSWDCDPVTGCYDPGTGNGQYTTLSDCQLNCSNGLCDSLVISGSQSQLTITANNINTPIDHWMTIGESFSGLSILAEDSMSLTHNVYNYNPITSLPYDTITTCILYTSNNPVGTVSCCVTWVWSGFWSRLLTSTSITELHTLNKRLFKVVDVLGRESKETNQPLFYIYDDGTVEKKIIIE